MRHFSFLDQCVIDLDKSLRTVFGKSSAERDYPARRILEAELTPSERRQSAGLMRVNHAGEVSAQALYHAQALTARSATVRKSMHISAIEENDHLAWCENRLQELSSHSSYLNAFWYLGSFMIGLVAGMAGDKWSLGFVAETERQVVKHLESHLEKMAVHDEKSRKVIEQMRDDEMYHATVAITAGAAELPAPIKFLMACMSKVMTRTAYWI